MLSYRCYLARVSRWTSPQDSTRRLMCCEPPVLTNFTVARPPVQLILLSTPSCGDVISHRERHCWSNDKNRPGIMLAGSFVSTRHPVCGSDRGGQFSKSSLGRRWSPSLAALDNKLRNGNQHFEWRNEGQCAGEWQLYGRWNNGTRTNQFIVVSTRSRRQRLGMGDSLYET
jgi:hypothetical protein